MENTKMLLQDCIVSTVPQKVVDHAIELLDPSRCYKQGCKAMGGPRTSSLKHCQMDFCVATKQNVTVFYPTVV